MKKWAEELAPVPANSILSGATVPWRVLSVALKSGLPAGVTPKGVKPNEAGLLEFHRDNRAIRRKPRRLRLGRAYRSVSIRPIEDSQNCSVPAVKLSEI